ncbi:MAG: B12-binding domain-containing radical SAM protein [Bacillota bacterium]
MRVLLTTLNSKFIHSALALRYLKSYCKNDGFDISIEEYTINHDPDYVLGEIYKNRYGVVCFSCYIWNITMIHGIVRNLKKVKPNLIIVLGGPEVSYDPVQIMEENQSIDYIISGEGERTFKELMGYIIDNKGKLEEIRGIAYRHHGNVLKNQERELIENLDEIPSPYNAALKEYENRIIYYESSRGCPHNCSYCLSSTMKGVRFFSIERVKQDLQLFIKERVKQVKFVDRTFNVKKKHSLEIMKYIAQHDNGYTNFHFEITADLLDEEILDFLSTVREGLFQFEVGVQTTYDKTMAAIERKVDFSILSKAVTQISSFRNIHLHLDLIAGLPYEDYERFKHSFDDVYLLKPEKLQLGFLKLLKGAGIRENAKSHGYIFRDEAPYEVLASDYISYEELLKLKTIEELVESYYNSHGFDHSLKFLLANHYNRPSDFYETLADYWEDHGYQHAAHNRTQLYEILLQFYKGYKFPYYELFEEIMKFDFLLQGKASLPNFFVHIETEDFKNRCHRFLQSEENVQKYLPVYESIPAKQMIKKVHFECFSYDILEVIDQPCTFYNEKKLTTILFDYDIEHKVFQKSKWFKIEL